MIQLEMLYIQIAEFVPCSLWMLGIEVPAGSHCKQVDYFFNNISRAMARDSVHVTGITL